MVIVLLGLSAGLPVVVLTRALNKSTFVNMVVLIEHLFYRMW